MLTLVDHMYAVSWQVFRRFSLGRRLWQDRALRVSVVAVVHILAALAMTLLAPMWLLLLAPLIFGVPHVASDLRWLVLRPPRVLPRGLPVTLLLPFALMTILRVVAMTGGTAFPRVELLLGVLAIGLAILWTRGRSKRRWILGGGAIGLGVVTLWAPAAAALVIGHIHNFVAVGLWFWWAGARNPSASRWVVVAALTVALALIGSGWLDHWWWEHATEPAAGLTLSGLVAALAPDLTGPWGLRAVMAFALMQAVHYSLWLWCIPATSAIQRVAEPLAPSVRWRGWRSDFGSTGLVIVSIAAILLPTVGWFAPVDARAGYLSLVLFHGWLELAVGAHLLVVGLDDHR